MEKKSAFQTLLDMLNRADKTVKQAKDALAKKGYFPEEIAEAIKKAEEFRFLNDAKYAERYVYFKKDGRGKYRILQELKEKGISEQTAADALNGYTDSAENCKAAAEKFIRGKSFDEKLPEKLLRHLLYRGFSYEEAKACLYGLRDRMEQPDDFLED